MKKVVKFICLLIIAGLIAILVLRNGANAEGTFTIALAQNATVGDTVNLTVRFPKEVSSFSGTITSSNDNVISKVGAAGISYGIDGGDPVSSQVYQLNANGAGDATIRVEIEATYADGSGSDSFTADAGISVSEGTTPVAAPVLSVDNSSITAGSQATVSVSNGVEVIWTFSGNLEELSRTTTSIVVRGTSAGSGVVTAIGEGGTVQQSITVTEATPPPTDDSPVITIDNNSLVVGGDPTTARSNKGVRWGSTNTQVATVSTDSSTQATIIPIGPGECQIVGQGGNDRTGSVTVTVAEAPAPDMEASAPRIYPSSNIKLFVGQVAALDSDQGVTWSSSNSSVISVSSDGEVTAKGEGEASITAKSKTTGKTTSKSITVVAAPGGNTDTPADSSNSEAPSPAASIAISPNKNQSIKIGETIQFKVTKGTASSWESSKSAVASVDSNGTVKGVKAGTTYISAIASDGSVAQVKVTVSSGDENATNSTSTTNEVVPATGEAPTQLLVILGAITFIVAVAIFRKKTK